MPPRPPFAAEDDLAALSEEKFLQREAARAKAAFVQSFKRAGRDVARGVDPRGVTREHPWISMTAAALAGFLVTSAVVPSKDQQLVKRLKKLREAVTEPPKSAAADEKAKPKSKASRASALVGVIGLELFKLLRPLLTSVISSGLLKDQPPADGEPDGTASATNPGGVQPPSAAAPAAGAMRDAVN